MSKARESAGGPDAGAPRALVVGMDRAVVAVRQALAARPAPDSARVRIVGITGPVGAGKSTLAALISASVLSTDDYLPDYDQTPEHLRDVPEAADLARLLLDLSSLRAGRATRVPCWSFQSHNRVGEREVTPGSIIVVEGLHALHHTHGAALDVRVFVDAPRGLRLARWEHLEATGQRGWGVEYARTFFESVAEPTFERYAPAYRGIADIVVTNDHPEPIAHTPGASTPRADARGDVTP